MLSAWTEVYTYVHMYVCMYVHATAVVLKLLPRLSGVYWGGGGHKEGAFRLPPSLTFYHLNLASL